MKVGRNDPCPCGSGKKYKKCCMENGNIIPFPGVQNQDPQMEEYKKYCEFAHENGMLIPSFMEYMGTPNSASDFLGDIQKEIDNSGLSSIDEINDLLQQKMQKNNTSPKEDFLGLSPKQINQILNTPLEDCEIVELNDEVDETYLREAPILVDLWLFLLLFAENEGKILLTSTGKLPKSFCREFAEKKYRGHRAIESIKSEDDLPELRPMVILLDDIGYIEVMKTRIKMTEETYLLFLERNDHELFYFYLESYLYDYCWETQTCNEEEPGGSFIQRSVPFSLYLLKQTKGEPFSMTDLYSRFVKAFPVYEELYISEEAFNFAEYSYNILFLRDFCSAFGLVEVVNDNIKVDLTKIEPKDIKMKTTELFDELFIWNVK